MGGYAIKDVRGTSDPPSCACGKISLALRPSSSRAESYIFPWHLASTSTIILTCYVVVLVACVMAGQRFQQVGHSLQSIATVGEGLAHTLSSALTEGGRELKDALDQAEAKLNYLNDHLA